MFFNSYLYLKFWSRKEVHLSFPSLAANRTHFIHSSVNTVLRVVVVTQSRGQASVITELRKHSKDEKGDPTRSLLRWLGLLPEHIWLVGFTTGTCHQPSLASNSLSSCLSLFERWDCVCPQYIDFPVTRGTVTRAGGVTRLHFNHPSWCVDCPHPWSLLRHFDRQGSPRLSQASHQPQGSPLRGLSGPCLLSTRGYLGVCSPWLSSWGTECHHRPLEPLETPTGERRPWVWSLH